MRKASIIHSHKKGGSSKLGLIGAIIKLSKLANERFGIKILTFDELENMPLNQLKNINAELHIQLKIPRRNVTTYYKP